MYLLERCLRWKVVAAIALLLVMSPLALAIDFEVVGCGNQICDLGESPDLCCEDCKCPDGQACTPLGCVGIVEMDSLGVDRLLTNVSYSEGTERAIAQARGFAGNFALAFSCGECVIQVLIPSKELNVACDECAAGMDSFTMGFFWVFDVEREEFIAYCGDSNWQWGEFIVPKEIVMFGFFLMLIAVIFHFLGVHGQIKEIESLEYEGTLEKIRGQSRTWFAIMKPVYEKVAKLKREGEGSDRYLIQFKLTVAALGFLSFVLAGAVAFFLASYALGEGMECAHFGFKLALGFTWAYFLVMSFSEAVTSFGVEELSDGDLDSYVSGMSDSDKNTLSKVTSSEEERANPEQAKDSSEQRGVLKDRLKKSMGWTNMKGSGSKKEIGYFYLEDFIGLPNFIAKLVIDPFRHPIGRTIIVLMLFDIFDPIRWEWTYLLQLNGIVFGAYLLLCLEWEFKGMLVTGAAYIADLFFGAFMKIGGRLSGRS